MPSLNNPKRELFAQELAKGTTAMAAYEIAGYKDGQKHAHRLGKDSGVVGRVAELLAERAKMHAEATQIATEALGIDREWVLARLKENAQRAMQAVPAADGQFKYDGSVANRALELLGKEIGMFIDRAETSNVQWIVSDKPLSDEERAEPTSH
jgi:phage terminase small subunit